MSVSDFTPLARAAIDRYVGADTLTVRPAQRKAGAVLAELIADTGGDYGAHHRQRVADPLPIPSAALPPLP